MIFLENNLKNIGIIMEKMEKSLEETLLIAENEHQHIALSDKFHIISEILEALKYIHSYNAVHRDIKPSNILVKRNLQIVKINDL